MKLYRLAILFLPVFLAGCLSGGSRGSVLDDGRASGALAAAMTRLGCAYVLAAQGPWQFDCSGLVIWSYKQAYPALMLRDEYGGLVDDATADVLWRYNVQRIEAGAARPGDLVFVSWDQNRVTHVGLFGRWLAEGRFELVNASSYHGRVVNEPWPLYGLNRGMWLVGMGRLRTAGP